MAHGFIWWILVGLVAGFLTGKLMKGSGYGVFGDIIVGIIGAVIGGFIVTVIIAIVGAVILTFLLRLISGNRA